jgi:hypothetical protein
MASYLQGIGDKGMGSVSAGEFCRVTLGITGNSPRKVKLLFYPLIPTFHCYKLSTFSQFLQSF